MGNARNPRNLLTSNATMKGDSSFKP
jgi:hypothetical protein